MSYNSIVEMARSGSLLGRITAAAAAENIDNPDSWVASRMWKFAGQPGWADKWAFASDNWNVNANSDFGVRTDVISDADILTAVQALNTAQVA